MSSRSGEETAASAAIRARPSPLAAPEPIIAMPVSAITVRTSAKSTLMSPGRVMSSAMPCTAPCRTWFADFNASRSVVSGPSTVSSFWFGMVIRESQNLPSSAMPWSAISERLPPSISNGFVTTATVRIPSSFAICATTGAAPVPVPPPMPAVIKSISQPSTSSMMRSRSSIAACRPTSGSAPAPKPLVMLQPICRAVFTLECLSACASVLMHMKSTPSIPLATMWVTALPPPPPTPMTLITALWLYASISSNIVVAPIRRTGWLKLHLSYYRSVSSKVSLEPGAHAIERALRAREPAAFCSGHYVVAGIEQKPHARGINGIAHDVGEPLHLLRHPEAHRHVKHFLGKLDRAFHLGAAAGEHDARGDELLEAASAQLLAHEAKELLIARLDDLGERLAREAPCGAVTDARHFDALVRIGKLRERAGVADLDVFGVLRRRAHRHGNVVRDLVAGDRDHRGVADRAVGEHRKVGRAAADIDEAHSELLLILGQYGKTRGQLLEHHLLHREPAALDALLDVLCGAVGAGDDVDLRLQAHAGHADRIADALLAVDDELLR